MARIGMAVLRLTHIGLLALGFVLLIPFGCSEVCPYSDDPDLDLSAHLCAFRDHPQNPLIEPPPSEFLIGDPTVVPPEEAPDGKWHLFANSLMGIYHHHSADGIKWTQLSPPLFLVLSMRPYIYKEGKTFHLLFEQQKSGATSEIQVSTSKDLFTWSAPLTLLRPELSWEKEGTATVGNPFLMKREGKYWLYYSAGGVWLKDTGVFEPRQIGLARSDSLLGPYAKLPSPLLSPSASAAYRNLGAGSIKLLDHRMGSRFVALENGIYRDQAGHSRSAILVLSSTDGLAWSQVCPSPVLAPTDSGWKSSFVYAFDSLVREDELWVYYNAREGWAPATERIGLSMLSVGCEPGE